MKRFNSNSRRSEMTISQRILLEAKYIVNTHATVRETALLFGISKSAVHNDMTKRLHSVCPELCGAICKILDENKAIHHIRGGESTKIMHLSKKLSKIS